MSSSPVATTAPEPMSPSRRLSGLRDDAGRVVRVTMGEGPGTATVPEVERELRHAEADAALVILDLRALKAIDRSAVQMMLASDRRIRRAGGLLLVVRRPECVQLVDQPLAQVPSPAP